MKVHKQKIATLRATLTFIWAVLAGQTAGAERGGGLTAGTNDARRHVTLQLTDHWRLGSLRSERFDASGLLFYKGRLLTINDRGPELFEIIRGTNHTGELRPTEFFPRAALAKVHPAHHGRYDSEGIASDESGNLYICEESKRAVFRSAEGRLELIDIDWSPARPFFRGSINASFEGIAIGGGMLYLANERDLARIVVVDLERRTVVETFFVDSTTFALGGPHYSDLAFADGRLFILDRNHRCILEVDPASKKVVVEHSFGTTEVAQEFAYHTDYPTGTMEGLAVDGDSFWLITDNNGRGRFADRNDFRPTLFRFRRGR